MSTAGRNLREIFQCHVYCIKGKADDVLLSTFRARTDEIPDQLV